MFIVLVGSLTIMLVLRVPTKVSVILSLALTLVAKAILTKNNPTEPLLPDDTDTEK